MHRTNISHYLLTCCLFVAGLWLVVYYRGTVALGRTGLIPAAHAYEGGLRKVGMPGMSGD